MFLGLRLSRYQMCKNSIVDTKFWKICVLSVTDTVNEEVWTQIFQEHSSFLKKNINLKELCPA